MTEDKDRGDESQANFVAHGQFNPHHEGNIGQGPTLTNNLKSMARFDDNDEALQRQQQRAREEFLNKKGKEGPPDGKYDSIVDLIAEAKNESVARLYLYSAMGRWIDNGDDWSTRFNIEELSKRASIISPEVAFLSGEKWGADKEKYERLSNALTVVQDLNLVFIKYYGFYRNISASGKVFQAAFAQEAEFMVPERFARVYADLLGFKEDDKEWKSVSEQIDIYVRASIYLGLQSDPRFKKDLKWYKEGKGFKKLFANDADELDWVRRYKLKTLPNLSNDFAPYKGKNVDDLSPDQLKHLDSEPAMNRYADPGDGASVKAIKEMLVELMTRGKYKDNTTMAKQAQFAFDLGDKTFKIFGLDAMYGTKGLEFLVKINLDRVDEVTKLNYVVKKLNYVEVFALKGEYEVLETTKIVNEGYPWNQSIVDAMHPDDKVTYNRQSSYFVGAKVWEWFAPKNIMVDFLHMLPVSNAEFPDSKFLTRSAFELVRDGQTIGDIMKNEASVGDWAYRAYLIRILFTYKEDFGAILALTNELERGKQTEGLISAKFLENVEKSIHIVCRNWIVTGGRFEEWFKDHKVEIDKQANDPNFLKDLNEKYSKKVIPITVTGKIAEMEAAENVLSGYVTKEKNRWKAIVWLTGLSFMGTVRSTQRDDVVRVAKRVRFLDPNVLDASLNFNFSQNDDLLRKDMEKFIKLAEFSKQ